MLNPEKETARQLGSTRADNKNKLQRNCIKNPSISQGEILRKLEAST